MKMQLNKDELYPVYSIHDIDQYFSYMAVELDDEFIAHYKKVMSDFFEIQRKLESSWNQQSKGE